MVTVWMTLSLLVNVTVAPAATKMQRGVKADAWIVTLVVAVAVAAEQAGAPPYLELPPPRIP
jgi:hypothetical protein